MSYRRRFLAGLCIIGLLGLSGCRATTSPTLGDDVLLGDNSYGWKTSKDVGFRFSNGLTVVPIGKGPLTIEAVEPVVEGNTVRVLGVKVRVLPADAHEGQYQQLAGWPPKASAPDEKPLVAGLSEPGDVQIAAPSVGSDGLRPHLHVVVGYEVVGEGRGVQRGIWVTYKYEGDSRRVFLGSYLAVCAPKTVNCQQEDEDGPVPE